MLSEKLIPLIHFILGQKKIRLIKSEVAFENLCSSSLWNNNLVFGVLSFGSSAGTYHSFYLPRYLKFEEGKKGINVLFFAVSFELASCSWSVEEECLWP